MSCHGIILIMIHYIKHNNCGGLECVNMTLYVSVVFKSFLCFIVYSF